MAEETFALKIYTPIGLALDVQVESVVLPTKDGEIGVLTRHTKYCGLAGTGILEYLESGQSSGSRLVISGGVVNFTDEALTILADAVDFADSVDRESYADARESLVESLKDADIEDPESKYSADKLARIEAIDQLISH